MVEPWMSGTFGDVHAVLRAVLHSFEHAKLDLAACTEGLSPEQLWTNELGVASVGFHLQHIPGSVDRLFTYARGEMLTEDQMAYLRTEGDPGAGRDELLAALGATLARIAGEVRLIEPATLTEPRTVGRKKLPTSLAGLLVHIAEHTQRHVGQAVTTAAILKKRAA